MKSDSVWFGLLAKSALGGLAEYYDKHESLLQSAKEQAASKINREINELAKNAHLNEDEEYAEWSIKMQEHEATYDMLFTNFFRYSFLVLTYVVLEDHLHRLCLALQDVKKLDEPAPYPSADILKTYKAYVQRAGVTATPELWESMEDLQSVRNCIVHSSGDVVRSRYKAKINSVAAKNVGVQVSGKHERYEMTPLYLKDGMVMVESRYCTKVTQDMHNLIEATLR